MLEIFDATPPEQLTPLLLTSLTIYSGGVGLSIHPQSSSSDQSSRYPALTLTIMQLSIRKLERALIVVIQLNEYEILKISLVIMKRDSQKLSVVLAQRIPYLQLGRDPGLKTFQCKRRKLIDNQLLPINLFARTDHFLQAPATQK